MPKHPGKDDKLHVYLKSDGGDESIAQASPPPERISARVSSLPSQHVSMRSGQGFNRTLWASWAVMSGTRSV
jgi:hypothetical protein